MTFFFSEAPLGASAFKAKLLLLNRAAEFVVDLGMEKEVVATGNNAATTKLTTLMMMIRIG
jgi:hypothetical protein